jgi:hypothetical protein
VPGLQFEGDAACISFDDWIAGVAGNTLDYKYDAAGQLVSATGRESSTTTRLHEQLACLYDAAGNLSIRTNGEALVQCGADNLNPFISRTSLNTNLTVAGSVAPGATNVTVNGRTASRYGDGTFAREGLAWVAGSNNTFAAVAQDAYGRIATNRLDWKGGSSLGLLYGGNGNPTNDTVLFYEYDDEN